MLKESLPLNYPYPNWVVSSFSWGESLKNHHKCSSPSLKGENLENHLSITKRIGQKGITTYLATTNLNK